MKRMKLRRSAALIIKKRKGLSFTPFAVQVGELPKKKEKSGER